MVVSQVLLLLAQLAIVLAGAAFVFQSRRWGVRLLLVGVILVITSTQVTPGWLPPDP